MLANFCCLCQSFTSLFHLCQTKICVFLISVFFASMLNTFQSWILYRNLWKVPAQHSQASGISLFLLSTSWELKKEILCSIFTNFKYLIGVFPIICKCLVEGESMEVYKNKKEIFGFVIIKNITPLNCNLVISTCPVLFQGYKHFSKRVL